LFKYRRFGQVEFRHMQRLDAVHDLGESSRQKTGSNAVSDGSQAQIDACRLNLIFFNRFIGRDASCGNEFPDVLLWQNAGRKSGSFNCLLGKEPDLGNSSAQN
jgi:hypothetical protein